MCYAIPGRIKGFGGKFAIVDYFGEEKKAINELPDVKVGDYVYAQGGFLITVVDAKEAEETLSVWRDLFFELQEIDSNSVKNLAGFGQKYDHLQSLFKLVETGQKLSLEDKKYLLSIADKDEQQFLFDSANVLRQKYHKNSCCVHGVIEISNICRRNCQYCGISTYNVHMKRYRMSHEEVMDSVRVAVNKYGFKALVLQSAEDTGRSLEELVALIRQIKKELAVLIFVSFGEVGEKGLEQLYEAGARGILLRFETSNPDLYGKLHPGYTLENRLKELRRANELGYLIVTGSLVGLPGQTVDDVINDIDLAQELNAEMLSLGPFLPHSQTPLGQYPAPKANDILKVLAAARFILPEHVKILVTTGLETMDPALRRKGLLSGGNSVMLNATPLEYRKWYEIYPKRAHEEESLDRQIEDVKQLLQDLGRAPTDLSFS